MKFWLPLLVVLVGWAGMAGARVLPPPANTAMLLNCEGLSATAQAWCQRLTTLDPTAGWAAGEHVNFRAGSADRAVGTVAQAVGTHGGAFAAAAAQQIGIYLLRPPQYPQSGLENAQFVWLWNQAAGNLATVPASGLALRVGWTVIGRNAAANNVSAQTYANTGYLVIAASPAPFASAICQADYLASVAAMNINSPGKTLSYNPNCATTGAGFGAGSGTGQIAIVRPNAAYLAAGLAATYGPVVAQAGNTNATANTAATGFGSSFNAGQVYYFVYGGVPPDQQTAYAGLFGDGSAGLRSYAVQRSAQGALSLGIFTFDNNGLPLWYWGEGTLSAAGATSMTPGRAFVTSAAPAGPQAGNYDSPFLFKPYYQPATTGANLVDPDGDPMPVTWAGSFTLGFDPFANAALSVSVGLSDSGIVQGPSAPISTTGNLALSLAGQALTRTLSGQPAASAPATGWWWASYSQADWNSSSSTIKPLALFLDVSGSTVSAIIAGAVATPATSGSPVAPYRPYWWSFVGTVQGNGLVDGTASQCQSLNGQVTCAVQSSATLTPNNDGTLSLILGSQQVTFNRYNPLTSLNNYTQITPSYSLPYALGTGVAAGQLMVNVAIQGSTAGTFPVQLDTGSRGFWISPDRAPPGTVQTAATPPGYIFYWSSGVAHVGFWAPLTLTFPEAVASGGAAATASATVPVLIVTGTGCVQGNWPNRVCPQTNFQPPPPGGGFMGIGFDRTGHGTGYGSAMPDPTGPGTSYNLQILNPLLNLDGMVAGTMRSGYILGTQGITLGPTATSGAKGFQDSRSSYAYSKLKPTGTQPVPGAPMAPTDWQVMTGAVTLGGQTYAMDQAVIDIGIQNMLFTPPVGASLTGTTVLGTTAYLSAASGVMTVALLGSSGLYGYSFALTNPNVFAAPNQTMIPTNAALSPSQTVWWTGESSDTLINTGIYALNGFNYLYDAQNGYIGLQLNAQSAGSGAFLTIPSASAQ